LGVDKMRARTGGRGLAMGNINNININKINFSSSHHGTTEFNNGQIISKSRVTR
jgi:hypothetical protein